MLCSCWAAKGGTGTTVTAVSLAVLWAARAQGGVLLVDLAGDAPAALGVPEPDGPGLGEWWGAGESVPVEAVSRLEVQVAPGLGLIPRGTGPLEGVDQAERLAAWLASEPRPVVVDCGVVRASGAAATIAAASSRSLLVTRACYLSLRRVAGLPLRPSGVVLLSEVGRAMSRADVARITGAPIVAEVAVDPAVARAVDAGVLLTRVPRALARSLRGAA